jgi:hypothetical protein
LPKRDAIGQQAVSGTEVVGDLELMPLIAAVERLHFLPVVLGEIELFQIVVGLMVKRLPRCIAHRRRCSFRSAAATLFPRAAEVFACRRWTRQAIIPSVTTV